MASTPFRLVVEAAGNLRQPYGAAENRIPTANSTELCGRIMPLPAFARSRHVDAPYAPELFRMYHVGRPENPDHPEPDPARRGAAAAKAARRHRRSADDPACLAARGRG